MITQNLMTIKIVGDVITITSKDTSVSYLYHTIPQALKAWEMDGNKVTSKRLKQWRQQN